MLGISISVQDIINFFKKGYEKKIEKEIIRFVTEETSKSQGYITAPFIASRLNKQTKLIIKIIEESEHLEFRDVQKRKEEKTVHLKNNS